MSWFIGNTLASIVAAFVVMRIFDYVSSGIHQGVASAVRAGLFVGTWTVVTTGTGMRGFLTRVRQLRHRGREVRSRIDSFPTDARH